MDPNNNEQTELLRNIWNEMKAQGQTLNTKIENLGAKIDKTNERLESLGQDLGTKLDKTNERLDKVEVRLDKVEGAVKELTIQHRWMSSFVENHVEQDLTRIKERLDALEAQREGH